MSLFITFEGGEGAGKTSVMAKLKRHFKTNNIDYIATKEPGGTRIGDAIRSVLLDPGFTEFNPLSELLLYLASRKQHLEELIKPALKDKKIVLCDRYEDSSLAYQGHARGLGMDKIRALSRAAGIDLQPHLTILLDIDPQTGLERAMGRSFEEITRFEHERMKFHQLVREGFLILAEQESSRYEVIDAGQPLEVVIQQVIASVTARLESVQ